jgi:hypothetical protein
MMLPIMPEEPGQEPTTWAMLELQGEVERRDGCSPDEPLDVGSLSLSSNVRSKQNG